MKTKWTKAYGAYQIEMMSAAVSIKKQNGVVMCPVCRQNQLRFYYHEFAVEPRRTGTIWVWCNKCMIWDHISRIELPQNYHYADPFAEFGLKEFDRLERSNWLDRLEKMWEVQSIPHEFLTDRKTI